MRLGLEENNLSQCDVATVGERSDDEARGVAQVLVVVKELSIADIGETVIHFVIPAVSIEYK